MTDKRYELTFIRKKHEYGDVYSFEFSSPTPVDFTPGQFGNFLLYGHDTSEKNVTRKFSFTNLPGENVSITTHVREKSSFKQELGALKEGDPFILFQVKGTFVLPEPLEQPIVLVAAGIGITPIHSMLKAHAGKDEDITLVHVSDGDYLFEEELAALPFSQFRITSKEINAYLETLHKEKRDAKFYVSGPPGFVDVMKEVLQKLGVEEKNIKQDWFDGYEDL